MPMLHYEGSGPRFATVLFMSGTPLSPNVGAFPYPLRQRGASASAPPAGKTAPGFVEESTPWLIALLLLLDVYVIGSRAPEVLYVIGGIRVPLWPVLLNIAAFFCVFAGGEIRRVFFSKTSISLILFTGWVMFVLPFSYDRSASFGVLTRSWLPSMLVFYVVSGNTRTMRLLKTVGLVVGLCSLQIAVISFLLGKSLKDRFSMEIGTLGNANDLAALLLFGFPFLLYRAIRPGAGIFMQLLAGGVGGLVLLLVLRTGSRSGVLTIVLIGLMGILWSTWQVRVKVLLAGALSLMLVLPFVPAYSMQRIMTLVESNDDEMTGAEGEAEASRRSRTELFLTSVRLAFTHPFTGVGIGQFQAAEYRDAISSGRRAKWLAPHNTLTQVASENGLPALLLYGFFLAAALRRVDRARRMWRQMEGWSDNYYVAMCLELAMIGYVFNSMFGSNAYLPYIPVLAGLGEASHRLVERRRAQMLTASSPARPTPAPRMPLPAALPVPPRRHV